MEINENWLQQKVKKLSVTKFDTHNFFNENLVFWGNKDRKPMLKITHSRDLFHINYLFVKFIVETLCTFYDFFSIHKQTFHVLGLVEIKLLSKERLFDIFFDFLIQWYDFRTYIDHLKIFLICEDIKQKSRTSPRRKAL